MKLSDCVKRNQKFTVGVFLGGASSEKEISLESGRHIYNSLNRERYDVLPIFVDKDLSMYQIAENMLWLNTTEDITREIEEENIERIFYQQIPNIIDFAFLGLHGKWVEDGALQGLLELLSLPYNGAGVLGSSIGNDKYYQRKLLKAYDIKTPKFYPVLKKDWQINKQKIVEMIESKFIYPMVSKPSREGCSTAIAKVKTREELKKGIEDAFVWDSLILVEEFIDAPEITCTVGNDNKIRAFTPTQTPRKHDILTVEEKFLPGDASMLTPPPNMDKKTVEYIKTEFIKAYKALELSIYSRIDAFWKDNNLIILEPNTLPGVTPSTMVFHQAAEEGLNPTQFIDLIVDLSIENYENNIGPKK